MIKITLNNGSEKEYPKGTTSYDIAKDISMGLAKQVMAAEINGETKDLTYKIEEDSTLNLLKFSDKGGKDTYRHTSSHILAQAIKNLFPKAKLAIGPAIDTGFYYDFDVEKAFSQDQFELIEKEMKKIIDEDLPISKIVMNREEAIAFMEKQEEPYKIELIKDLPEDSILSFYKQGDFIDLCAGPHLPSTGKVSAIKLTQVAGAYWRGNEKNKMLSRIYGTSFNSNKDLKKYLAQVEEAKKRDHNKIGRELKLFMTDENIGQGLPLLMPKGAKIVQLLQRFIEDEEEKRGYQLTKTPIMAKSDLYKVSGHWQHYKEGMFVLGDEEKDDEVLALRPMTCPFQFTIFNTKLHSYRDLPVRYAETSTLFRNEASGEMHGLIRLRQFTISEGHIICTPEQLENEFNDVLDLIDYVMTILGIKEDIWYRFSKWDPKNKEKYIDNPEAWADTETKLKAILEKSGLEYEEAEDEAAFYGPKLDIQFKNVHGKEDTIITIQIDFALPERFDMNYIDNEGNKQKPYVIHRTSIGCYERTLAMLIEKYAGAFPTWIAPVQVKILPIIDKQHDYTLEVKKLLQAKGIRVETDLRNEKIGYKIREARLEKIPYILVIGDREMEGNQVAVRTRKEGDMGAMLTDKFIEMICEDIDLKKI